MIDDSVQYYPFNFVAPTGDVFFAGADAGTDATHIPSTSGLFFDVDNGGIVPTGEDSATDGGSAVMYRPGQVMKCGGTPEGSGTAIATTEIIDLNVSNQWGPAAPMNIPRRRHNTTLLPDGTVLVTGGTRSGNREFEFDGRCGGGDDGVACNSSNACEEDQMCVFNPSGAQQWVAEAEIWDPDTDTWTLMAGSQTPRMYHSSALLLPDGRVISAGGGPRGFGGAFNTYSNAEIFSPPYLFRDGGRPVIDDAPEIIYYGNTFEVNSEQAPDVEAVNLIRLGAVTHSFDQNTRFVPLSFATRHRRHARRAGAAQRQRRSAGLLHAVSHLVGGCALGRAVRAAPAAGSGSGCALRIQREDRLRQTAGGGPRATRRGFLRHQRQHPQSFPGACSILQETGADRTAGDAAAGRNPAARRGCAELRRGTADRLPGVAPEADLDPRGACHRGLSGDPEPHGPRCDERLHHLRRWRMPAPLALTAVFISKPCRRGSERLQISLSPRRSCPAQIRSPLAPWRSRRAI